MSITDVDEITVSSGAAVVAGIPTNGTAQTARMILENSTKKIDVNTSAGAATYTLIYTHVDELITGGVSATLSVVTGMFTSYTDGIILGWIVYPGGGVPLANTMLYHAEKVSRTDPAYRRWETADVRHPPFFGLQELAVDANITYSVDTSLTGYLAYKLICNPLAVGSKTATFLTQHSVRNDGTSLLYPRQMLTAAQIPAAPASLEIDVRDSAGVSFDTHTWSNVAYGNQFWRLARDHTTPTWIFDGVFTIKWTFTLLAGQTAYWGRFALSYDRDLPYAVGYVLAGP